MKFRRYFGLKVAVVIDYFENFIERPSNFKARAQTWSYKHHNITEYLIGISPQGTVCFISEGYGGRASRFDKFMTNDCGFLEKYGDIVFVDRGFDIEESVA